MPVTPPPVTLLRRIALGAWAGLVALVLAAAPALGASAVVRPASPSGQMAGATSPAPVSLAVLVPLTVRPTATGLIDATTLAGYTAPLGVLTRQLDAVIGTPAVIGLDPMIVASIRVLGAAAPASATSWLERLRTSGNEVFALAYADADLAALARADALTLRDPIDFDFAIDPRNFGPSTTASPSPTPSASTTPPPVDAGSPPPLPRNAADVLAWTYTLPNIAWPSDDTVVADDLTDLSAAGYTSVVLNSSNVSSTTSGYVDLPGIHGIVADAGITTLVRDAVYSSDPAGPQDALDRVNSALRGLAAVSPGRTVVATLDRRWPLGALNLHALFDDLSAQSSVLSVGLTNVLAGAHPPARVVDEPGDAARTAQVGSAVQAIAAESQFATVATDPAAVTAPRRLALLALLAVSWLRGTDDWTAQVTNFLAASKTLIGSVQIVAGSDLVVGSGATNIPVTVSNALNVPVVVYVDVDSPSSVLQVRAQHVPLTVEPGSSNKAAIPVAALTNGQVDTTITLTSGAGVAIGNPDYVSVDLHPGWESVGTAIAIALLVLIFGGGIVRNIVKRRAARRTEPAETPAD